MTLEIAKVLIILALALYLFITEKVRMDVVALGVLSALALSGVVTPQAALAGFSDPAVITVWAMFILSAGLSATGIADFIGAQILKVAKQSEPGLIIVIMLTTGTLSAFMSNIGVAALMLPVVMDICRKTKVSPSRLLLPMAYASLLGGLITLIGSPPNLVASSALQESGSEPFSLFEFAPIGIPALLIGTLFMAFVGRLLLPKKLPGSSGEGFEGFHYAHAREEQNLRLRVSPESTFVGKTLEESRLGPLLGFRVHTIVRDRKLITEFDGEMVFEANDELLIQGKLKDYEIFSNWQAFEMANGAEIVELLALKKLVLISVEIQPGSALIDLTVMESDFGRRFDAHILSIRNQDGVKRSGIAGHRFAAGDRLQLETRKENYSRISDSDQFGGVELLAEESIADIYPNSDSLLELAIPDESHLIGLRLSETGLAEDLNLRILGIARKGGSVLFPAGDIQILKSDKLLVHGNAKSIALIKGLQSLVVEQSADSQPPKQVADLSKCEVTLSPQSNLVGKTLKQINFRNRFGLEVESIWRGGRSFGSHLRNMRLEFGDALLLSGPREKIEELSQERNLIVLTSQIGNTKKPIRPAIISSLIMVGVIVMILLGILPVAIAAVTGCTLMIVSKCLSIDEAYRSIDWKAVFLIACMLPLGVAMNDTGAARWLAEGLTYVVTPLGLLGVLIGLYLLTTLATTIVPTAALVLIMTSIGIDVSKQLGFSPQLVVLAIAFAASSSFTSPISHPSNVLVMGPGGYRFIDYIKVGALLGLVIMLTVIPIIWFLR